MILSNCPKLEQNPLKNNILVLDQLKDVFTRDHQAIKIQFDNDSVRTIKRFFISRDTNFIKRLENETILQNLLVKLSSDKSEHPKIKAEYFNDTSIRTQNISNDVFDSFFSNFNQIKRGWKRLNRKYGTRMVIGFSKIKYDGNFAAVFYETCCGTLCGGGNIGVFEKVKGKWLVLSEINLWRS
jgi:hypothetical protein